MLNEKDEIKQEQEELLEEVEELEQQVEEELSGEDAAQDEQDDPAAAVTAQLEQTKELLMRTAAEYDNYRKRTEKEKAAAVSLGSTIVLEKMLPVLDTLETAAESQCGDEDYKKGVCMTLSMLKDALSALGVSEIDALGAPFDPNFHAAVAQQQTDEYESGTVSGVMQKGYMFKDSVLRHAVVAVAS